MLEARGIEKSFGATRALRGVSIDVRRGEVLALLGQNGAGKSTLMSILAGALAPDRGALTLDGAPYAPLGPADAIGAGVVMVHQELSLCPHLTVRENVLLGDFPMRGPFVDAARMRARTREVLAELAPSIDPDERVMDLAPAAQQLVEIARAVARPSARVLVLDEPTSSLAAADAERLFTVVRGLRERGLAVLYSSHYLEEVKALCDRFVVLRDGEGAGGGDVATTPIAAMVERMAGRALGELYPRSTRAPGEVALRVEGLAGARLPRRATLEVRRGEVVGVAGLVGAGRTELLRAIAGLDPVQAGTVKVVGKLGMLSEDRKGEGLALERTIEENTTLSRLETLWLHRGDLEARARRWMGELAIKAREPSQAVRELSGGNQQKVALARLLDQDADVLLLDEPTRGVDVEAKAEIYARIDRAAASGKAVLVVSSYLPELVGVCDRVYVLAKGVLGPSRAARDVDEHALLVEAMSV